MKKFIFAVIIISAISCGKDKVIQLPEIDYSEISEINDVSAAYLFYDETQADSVELNRRNLISTTNWLVNVDKRLTLKQAIPHIQFLQEKKDNSSHKNETVKNYFTCHDINKRNLGFIEFTNSVYKFQDKNTLLNIEDDPSIKAINFNLNKEIFILNTEKEPFITKSNPQQLVNDIKTLDIKGNIISLRFNENLPFQDYITYKSILIKAGLKHAKISDHEFLDN